jgi:hypothetical protein
MKRKFSISALLIASAIFISLSITSCTEDPVNSATKTAGSLTVSATTSSYNGNYSPTHVLAIWVESSTGTFVKTLKVNAAARKQYLTNWYKATSAGNSVDALTGATINSHGAVTCKWNGTDVAGAVVGDGTYKVCMEFTEDNGTGKFASFTFTKGVAADSQTPAAKSNFSNVNLSWTPSN